MKPCQIIAFLMLLLLPYLQPQNVTEKKYKLDKVKTIVLGKPRTTHLKHNAAVPWNLKGVDIAESPENFSKSVEEKRLNYETLWNNGTFTLTLVRLNVEKSHTVFHNKTSDHQNTVIIQKPDNFFEPFLQADIASIIPDKGFIRGLRRFKRRIFGNDTRVRIPQQELRKIPFSAVVKISTGCTGTLISKIHVLTAAHCIHNGSHYIRSIRNIRIGLPKHNGRMRWARIKNIKVPQGWTTEKNSGYDYAVIKLVHRHRRKVLDIGSIVQVRGHINNHFLGFHQDKLPRTSIWYSYCVAKPLDQVIINRCDAMRGSSGAGVYVISGTGAKITRHIVGVLSGSGTVRFRNGKQAKRFNIITKLTPLKTAQICSWAKLAPSCHALVR